MQSYILLECIEDFVVMLPETLVFKKGEVYQAKWCDEDQWWVAMAENWKATCIFQDKEIDPEDDYFDYFRIV